VQAKAQEVVTGLRDSAKIEVVDPELKKSMDAAAAAARAGATLPGGDDGASEDDDASGDVDGGN